MDTCSRAVQCVSLFVILSSLFCLGTRKSGPDGQNWWRANQIFRFQKLMETMAGLLCKEQSTTAACITLVLCSVLNPQLRIEIQIFLGNFCPVKVRTVAIMAMIAHY